MIFVTNKTEQKKFEEIKPFEWTKGLKTKRKDNMHSPKIYCETK